MGSGAAAPSRCCRLATAEYNYRGGENEINRYSFLIKFLFIFLIKQINKGRSNEEDGQRSQVGASHQIDISNKSIHSWSCIVTVDAAR